MAARFWVTVAGSGTGTWDNSLTLHWSATSGGLGGQSAPGSGDTVTFDANSCPAGEVVTVNADVNITSITMGAFTGTLDFSANNNSPTMQTFNCSGTGTRTLNMGSGTWNITYAGGANTTVFDITTQTNLTFNSNTSTINLSGNNTINTRTINIGALSLNNVNISAGSDTISASITCNDLNYTGFTGTQNANTQTIKGNLTLGTGMTIGAGGNVITFSPTSGTKILTSNAVAIPRSLTINATVGAGVQLVDNLNISDSFRTLTLIQGVFDANNKNVTCGIFSSSNTNTRVLTMGSGTWTLTGNAATIWSTGTTTGLTVTASSAVINANYSGGTGTRSFALGATVLTNVTGGLNITAGSDTISFTSTTGGLTSLDFTGFSGIWGSGGTTLQIKSNLTLSSTMTNSYAAAISFNGTSGTGIITSNTNSFAATISFGGAGGTWQLADNFISTNTVTLSQGTLNANNKNITCLSFSSSNSNTRTLTLGSSLITLTGIGTIWNLATTTNLTFNANTSTIKANDASASTKTFSFGALTYYNLYLTGGGTGIFQIGTTTSSKTFNGITVDPPLTVQVFAGSTLVLSSPTLLISGNGGQLNTFQSTTGGQTWTISSATGTFNENYISLQDSIATGGGTFYAGAQSTNVSGNTGWIFTDAPDLNQNAKRDANMVPVMLAVSSEDGETVIPVYADANSHALFVMPF